MPPVPPSPPTISRRPCSACRCRTGDAKHQIPPVLSSGTVPQQLRVLLAPRAPFTPTPSSVPAPLPGKAQPALTAPTTGAAPPSPLPELAAPPLPGARAPACIQPSSHLLAPLQPRWHCHGTAAGTVRAGAAWRRRWAGARGPPSIPPPALNGWPLFQCPTSLGSAPLRVRRTCGGSRRLLGNRRRGLAGEPRG